MVGPNTLASIVWLVQTHWLPLYGWSKHIGFHPLCPIQLLLVCSKDGRTDKRILEEEKEEENERRGTNRKERKKERKKEREREQEKERKKKRREV